MDQSILRSKYPMLSLVMYVSSTRSKLQNDSTVNNGSLIDARSNFEVWRGDCVHVPQEYYAVYKPSNKIGTCRICKVNDGNKSGIFYKYLHGPHPHHHCLKNNNDIKLHITSCVATNLLQWTIFDWLPKATIFWIQATLWYSECKDKCL